jgi:hypothetical protein
LLLLARMLLYMYASRQPAQCLYLPHTQLTSTPDVRRNPQRIHHGPQSDHHQHHIERDSGVRHNPGHAILRYRYRGCIEIAHGVPLYADFPPSYQFAGRKCGNGVHHRRSSNFSDGRYRRVLLADDLVFCKGSGAARVDDTE